MSGVSLSLLLYKGVVSGLWQTVEILTGLISPEYIATEVYPKVSID